jgi:hypothetical protein
MWLETFGVLPTELHSALIALGPEGLDRRVLGWCWASDSSLSDRPAGHDAVAYSSCTRLYPRCAQRSPAAATLLKRASTHVALASYHGAPSLTTEGRPLAATASGAPAPVAPAEGAWSLVAPAGPAGYCDHQKNRKSVVGCDHLRCTQKGYHCQPLG